MKAEAVELVAEAMVVAERAVEVQEEVVWVAAAREVAGWEAAAREAVAKEAISAAAARAAAVWGAAVRAVAAAAVEEPEVVGKAAAA